MSVSNRESALLNAYLANYRAEQNRTVSSGRQSSQTAAQKGAAILNATDKTLPSLGNPYASTLQNIVGGVSTENSLNLDFMNRQVSLAKKKFDMANDYAQQVKKAQEYAEKQVKAAADAAQSAAGTNAGQVSQAGMTGMQEAADARNRRRNTPRNAPATTSGSSQGKPNTASATYRGRTAAERNASARARYEASEQAKADREFLTRKNAATGLAGVAKVVGNSLNRNLSKEQYAAAAENHNQSVRTRSAVPNQTRNAKTVKERQEKASGVLQKLQTDADYRAELAKTGRKLDSAEVEAVNQYVKSTKNTGFSGLKRVFDLAKNSDNLSKEEYAKKAAALNAELNQNSALRSKAQGNGAGQSAQAFAAGLYDSVPFLSKASDAMASAANATGLGTELPMLSKTLEDTKTYDPVAATAGTMVGKGMQYNLFNTAMAGTPLAQAMGKAGNAVVGQAQKIPVLGSILGAGAGDALGRILTDTTADLALDTLPSLASDVSEGKSAGEIAGNAAKNLAENVAMNALPEIGGAALSWAKGKFGKGSADMPIDPHVQKGYNGIINDGGAQNGTEINVGRSVEGTEPGGAGSGAADVQGTGRNANGNQGVFRQPVNDTAEKIGKVRERSYASSLRTESDLPDAVKQEFAAKPELYTQLSNTQTKARADAILAKGKNEAVASYQALLAARDPAAVPLGYELAKQYIADGDSDSAVELLRGMSKELTASGQFSQAAAISLMQNDPMTALRYAQRSIDDLNAGGAKELGRQWKNFSLTDAEIQAFKNIAAGDSQAIADAMEQVGNRLARQYPVSAFSKLAEARRLGFLLNPRTQIRNIAANVAQLPVTGVSDKVSAALQSLYAKTGKSTDFVQTKALHVDKTSRDVAEQVWNQVKDTIDGSSSYEQPISDAVKNAEVFKLGKGQEHNVLANVPGMKKGAQTLEILSEKFTGKNVFDQMSSEKSVMENIRQFTYGLLELGDAPFVKKHFTESLANIAAANKISSADQITSEMIAQATQDAMRATYKDDNAWTELFSSVHKLGGVGEVVMPFTKTPANMVARSLDYSPVGLAAGIKDFITKGGNPAEYIDEIAKGLTGTAGIALGVMLYKAGVLTGAESDNANQRAFEKQNGFLPFAIHIPDTNLYFRISDFQPSMMSVVTGAAWAQTTSGDATAEQAAKGAVTAFVNTLSDNTNLANVGELFGNRDGLGGGLWDTALSLPQSMVPSLSNAFAKTADTTVRNPYDATDPIQSQKKQIMARIPFLSKDLPAAYDTWGNEKQRSNAAFEMFLDPAAFTNQTTSSRDKEIQRLFDATGDMGVYPPSVRNGTKVDGLVLNNIQTSEYQRAAGQLNSQIVTAVMHTDEYQTADDATRVRMLKTAYTIGSEAGKEAANPDYVSENKDYIAYKNNGIRDALLTSSVGAVLDKARDEKRETTGNADASLNKAERWNAIPSLDSYDDMVSAYLLNGSDETAQKLYDKAGAEATAAYLDIYTATARNGEDDDSASQLEKLQTALPVLRNYDLTSAQKMDVASMFLQERSPAVRVQEQYGDDLALKYLDTYTQADADGNGKVSDAEFKNALLQAPGLSDEDVGRIYLSSKTTDDSTDEKAQAFYSSFGSAAVCDYLYLTYLGRAYHAAEANRKIAAGEGGNPNGSLTKADITAALNYMDLTNEERRAYFSLIAPSWKNPY